MNQYLFTYYTENNSKIITRIEAKNIALAIRAFLMRDEAIGFNDAVAFQVRRVVS